MFAITQKWAVSYLKYANGKYGERRIEFIKKLSQAVIMKSLYRGVRMREQ